MVITMKSYAFPGQVEELKKDLLEYRFKDSQKVLELCSLLEVYALRSDNKELLGFAYFYKGEAYYILNDIENMFLNIAKSVAYLDMTSQWDLLARAYNMMAITSINKGNAPVAVDYYLAALKCTKAHGLDVITCSIHINLGYLYMQNGIYHEALHHLEDAYQLYCKSSDKEAQIGRLIMIYTNLTTCYMLHGNLDMAGNYIEKLKQECKPYFNDMDYVYVGCMAAKYYHLCKEAQKRDAVIEDILKRLEKQLPILDLFDDLYSLCELALELKRYDVLLEISQMLEPVIQQMQLVNLEKKLFTLKIQYYKMTQQEENYLKATARFYELMMIMEEENKNMIANMLHVRTALERANESKKKVEEINAILTEKSETDQLTGLANRYRLTDTSQLLLEDCLKQQKTFSVEILDIDYFKEYNDNYGHQAGDECICKVASLIQAMEGDSIFGARYGGDEFIILYHGLSRQAVMEKAQHLKQAIHDLHLEHAYSKAFPFVTISQGICLDVPSEGNKGWDFLHVADEYLYQVKRNNRNGICIGNLKGDSRILP